MKTKRWVWIPLAFSVVTMGGDVEIRGRGNYSELCEDIHYAQSASMTRQARVGLQFRTGAEGGYAVFQGDKDNVITDPAGRPFRRRPGAGVFLTRTEGLGTDPENLLLVFEPPLGVPHRADPTGPGLVAPLSSPASVEITAGKLVLVATVAPETGIVDCVTAGGPAIGAGDGGGGGAGGGDSGGGGGAGGAGSGGGGPGAGAGDTADGWPCRDGTDCMSSCCLAFVCRETARCTGIPIGGGGAGGAGGAGGGPGPGADEPPEPGCFDEPESCEAVTGVCRPDCCGEFAPAGGDGAVAGSPDAQGCGFLGDACRAPGGEPGTCVWRCVETGSRQGCPYLGCCANWAEVQNPGTCNDITWCQN
jgi:hypothetical protein